MRWIMEAGDPRDDLLRALKNLVVAEHAPARARRIRDRAAGLLARRRRRALRRARLLADYSRFVEPTLASALSLGFAAWTVTRSIEVLYRARGGFFWP